MGSVVSAMAFPVPSRDFGREVLQNLPDKVIRQAQTKSGKAIPLLYLKNRDDQRSKYTFLFSHGNAEDLGRCYSFLRDICKITKCDVLGYEYIGYGNTEGKPSEKECYRSIDAAFNFLTKDMEVPTEEIILFGRSLGSGPSTDLAARTPGLGGLVLLSPLESGVRVVLGKGGSTAFFFLDLFQNYKKIPKADCTTFVMHGEEDEVIDVSHGKTLNKLAKKTVEPIWIPEVGHNDIPQGMIVDGLLYYCRKLEEAKRSNGS